MIDWEGLKALEAKAGNSFQGGHQFTNALIASFPAILAQHEQDQRVIAAAKKLRIAITALESDENEETEQAYIDALAEFDKVKP